MVVMCFPGGIVGIVVSFVLVFVAGLIIGLFLCKR